MKGRIETFLEKGRVTRWDIERGYFVEECVIRREVHVARPVASELRFSQGYPVSSGSRWIAWKGEIRQIAATAQTHGGVNGYYTTQNAIDAQLNEFIFCQYREAVNSLPALLKERAEAEFAVSSGQDCCSDCYHDANDWLTRVIAKINVITVREMPILLRDYKGDCVQEGCRAGKIELDHRLVDCPLCIRCGHE